MNGGIILPEFDPFLINFGGFGNFISRWWTGQWTMGKTGIYSEYSAV